MSLCRGAACRAEIDFVQLQRGRWHPVEGGGPPEVYYVETGDRAGSPQVLIVTPEGAMLRGRNARAHESGTTRAEGWVSHYGRCPDAAAFRRAGSAESRA